MTERMRWGVGLGVAAVLATGGSAAWLTLQGPRQETRLDTAPAVAPSALSPAASSNSPGATSGTASRPSTEASASIPAVPAPAAPSRSAESGPRFDVARIAPGGGTVVAGRAAPGAEVLLQDQGRELGRARADARGEFVIIPEVPLAPGTHELTLLSKDAQGQELRGEESVVVAVPQPPSTPGAAAEGPAMAVLMPAPGSGAAPRVLQGAPRTSGRLSLDVVDYDETGGIRFAGSAPAGQTVRLYIDQKHSGDSAAGADGRWTFRPGQPPAAGRHMLRVDQIGPQGQVVARVEVPFQRDMPLLTAAQAANAPAADRVVVQPGHSLWRIARQTYGRGTRYTEIHRANTDQIRDPHRIYPGQIFTLPTP